MRSSIWHSSSIRCAPGVLDVDRMWQINVAGTARVMEAITEANHEESHCPEICVSQQRFGLWIGPERDPRPRSIPWARTPCPTRSTRWNATKWCSSGRPALRGCSAYMLRPHIFAGASVENYMVGAFRGTPGGRSDRAASMRSRGNRLPCMLPSGRRYLENRIQFVHVDDMARLITRILEKTEPESQRLTVLNVAGRGDPLTFERCIEIAQASLWRLPGKLAFRMALKILWQLGIVAIPPEAAPYMTGEYIMNTDRLRKFLGENYEDVIRYTIADAFADCFKSGTDGSRSGRSARPPVSRRGTPPS